MTNLINNIQSTFGATNCLATATDGTNNRLNGTGLTLSVYQRAHTIAQAEMANCFLGDSICSVERAWHGRTLYRRNKTERIMLSKICWKLLYFYAADVLVVVAVAVGQAIAWLEDGFYCWQREYANGGVWSLLAKQQVHDHVHVTCLMSDVRWCFHFYFPLLHAHIDFMQ